MVPPTSIPDAGVTLPPGAPGLGTLLAEKYRLDGILGIGGMGVVYRSNHALLGIPVAVKIILPEFAARPEFVTRFTNEARAAARIQSDNIARVSDVGTTRDGISFLVMELLDGEDLGSILQREGPQSYERAVDWMLQAIVGLSDAHAAGIIHRDLKPSNLFLARRKGKADRIKLCDFGISKGTFEDGSSAITKTNTMLGSPAYMAPEQLRSSRTVDARADIWSLGIILYELLTGSTPFVGENVGAVFAAILETNPMPVRAMLPQIPEELDQAILRCLRRSPNERYSTAAELGVALAPFASDGGQEVLRRMASNRPYDGGAALSKTTPHYGSGGHEAARTPVPNNQTQRLSNPEPIPASSSGARAVPGVAAIGMNTPPGAVSLSDSASRSDPSLGLAAAAAASPRRGLAIVFALGSLAILATVALLVVRFAFATTATGGGPATTGSTSITGLVATTTTASASASSATTAPTESASAPSVQIAPSTSSVATHVPPPTTSAHHSPPPFVPPTKRNPTPPTPPSTGPATVAAPPPTAPPPATTQAPPPSAPTIYTDPWKKN